MHVQSVIGSDHERDARTRRAVPTKLSRQRRELPSRSNVPMLELMYRVESPATDPGDRPRWTNRGGPSYGRRYRVSNIDHYPCLIRSLFARRRSSGCSCLRHLRHLGRWTPRRWSEAHLYRRHNHAPSGMVPGRYRSRPTPSQDIVEVVATVIRDSPKNLPPGVDPAFRTFLGRPLSGATRIVVHQNCQ
jgi:hypothetical protein